MQQVENEATKEESSWKVMVVRHSDGQLRVAAAEKQAYRAPVTFSTAVLLNDTWAELLSHTFLDSTPVHLQLPA
jgi:hypothetical protein